MIYGSSVCALYYIFYCYSNTFWCYFALLTVSASVVFSISMMDWYYKNENKPLRTYVYIALGLLSGVSLLHAFALK